MNFHHKNPVMKSSDIKNTTVKNAVDENIGSIEDVMIDTSTGEIAYLVLSVDSGFLNMGSKYFAVPWQAFAFDTAQDNVFILNVEKERLENAPGFEKDDWPNLPQHEFLTEVRSYYGFNRATESNPPLGDRTTETIRDREDRTDPNRKQTNFI